MTATEFFRSLTDHRLIPEHIQERLGIPDVREKSRREWSVRVELMDPAHLAKPSP